MDGAGHLRVMFQIMLPQAKGMFFITLLNTFVGAWNSWYNASIYVPADKTKWPIQLFINEMTSANGHPELQPLPDSVCRDRGSHAAHHGGDALLPG